MTSYTCVACSRPMLWHRFSVPASDRLRAEWLESLGLDTQLRSDIDRKRRDRKRVFICERHFAAEDIMRTVRGHTFIADGILPIPVSWNQ